MILHTVSSYILTTGIEHQRQALTVLQDYWTVMVAYALVCSQWDERLGVTDGRHLSPPIVVHLQLYCSLAQCDDE
jgi:hypothetical protein